MIPLMRRSPTSPDPHEQELDTEINSIRAEIHNLQRRKRFLSSSLLSSAPVQTLLRAPQPAVSSLADEVSPLVHAAGRHADSNHHRIAFGATAFPFKDPSPTAPPEHRNLLGVRIDLCARGGRFTKPYYVLLRRERARADSAHDNRLRVHRHTVPSFISVSKLESAYLPVPGRPRADEQAGGSDAEDDVAAAKAARANARASRRQDLRGFVRELRRELAAWHLRADAVDLLREKLGLGDDSARPGMGTVERLSPDSKAGVIDLAATAVEARYVRLEWEDGRVGRFKLSNAGIVERAVVIGDRGRDKQTEDAMTGRGGRVETLLERLQERGSHLSS
ncbi:uncharacterized protein N7459_000563 [Penicillium hispanicum]|uniref:uncharacterized protein n=1 Tax=Penicillium hispanicum TaxID=1080232 RepID=UPI002540158E|nr:uncharacterized protein N7459_000563 [Penicillium hispanicum]KAJ5594355.1 hypothetical protein N7459_000563 [Penicillium hispanicum]